MNDPAQTSGDAVMASLVEGGGTRSVTEGVVLRRVHSPSLANARQLPLRGSPDHRRCFLQKPLERSVGNAALSVPRGGTPRIIATPVTAYAVPPAPSQTWSARLLEALRDPPCLLTSAPRFFVHRTRFGASPPFSERANLLISITVKSESLHIPMVIICRDCCPAVLFSITPCFRPHAKKTAISP